MYLDSISRFAELFMILLEPSRSYITIVTMIEAAPFTYSSSSILSCIYKCSTAILHFPFLLCTRVPFLRDFVLI